MPIYEYHCHMCGERVEVLVRSAAVAPACPQCGGALTDKLFSVPHVLSGRTYRSPGHTCCGQEERCDEPPCSHGEACRHQ